jgi:hypothetical protein
LQPSAGATVQSGQNASLQKQIAFSRRVLKAEEQTAGINAGLGDFLQEMSFEDTKLVFVCVGADHTMRGIQPVGWQVWKQEDPEMSAVNPVLDGMHTSPESVILSAIPEALAWRHVMETAAVPNYKRPGQRIVVYPKSLTKFPEVLQRCTHLKCSAQVARRYGARRCCHHF